MPKRQKCQEKRSVLDLGRRERQVLETVLKLGEASVAEVVAAMESPPSYSAVRAILGQLVQKEELSFRHSGKRYLYRPVVSKTKAQRSALRNLLTTLFGGNTSEAFVALLDVAGPSISDAELDRMKEQIDNAKKEGR